MIVLFYHLLFLALATDALFISSCSFRFWSSHFRKVSNIKRYLSDQAGITEIRKCLFEGDVVEYQIPMKLRNKHDSITHSLAAVTYNGKLQPLYRRESGDTTSEEILLYADDEQAEMKLNDTSIHIVALMDEFQYTQRIVEDRISNPHGEHAEDVWILRGASVIKSIIDKPNLFLRLGPFQH